MESGTVANFPLMRSLFDDRLNRLHRGSAVSDVTDAETESVKTYLLEWTGHTLAESKRRKALAETLSTPPSGAFKSLRVDFAKGDPLLQFTARYRRKRISAYVDFTDARFLKVHSTTKSELLDDLVQGWTAKLHELDHGWFDDSFLEHCSTLGDFRGIGVEFNNAPLTATDPESASDDKGESMGLRQSGRAADMLTLLRSSTTFSVQSSLAMVRVRYPRSAADQVITSEVRFDGRIAGRGNSFTRHSEVADRIIERYRERVLGAERRYSLHTEAVGTGYALRGRPFRIKLNPAVEDLALFCDRLFAAINPFRLSGVPRRVGADHFVVDAIDLHTVQTLRFELRPHAVWIFLPNGTCGNTLLRFVTNLQRHHSRLVEPDAL